jgi:hypothetical protein
MAAAVPPSAAPRLPMDGLVAPPLEHPKDGTVVVADAARARLARFTYMNDALVYYEEFDNESTWRVQYPILEGPFTAGRRTGVWTRVTNGHMVYINEDRGGTEISDPYGCSNGSASLALNLWQTASSKRPHISDPIARPIPITPFPTCDGTYTTTASDGRVGTYVVRDGIVEYTERAPFGRDYPILSGRVQDGQRVGVWRDITGAFDYDATPAELEEREAIQNAVWGQFLLAVGNLLFSERTRV